MDDTELVAQLKVESDKHRGQWGDNPLSTIMDMASIRLTELVVLKELNEKSTLDQSKTARKRVT